MALNRFFTVLVVPEKTSNVRKIILPYWLIKGVVVGLFFVTILVVIMLFDYWYVMSRISENRSLKIENRRLRQQVQVFKNKMNLLENTMDRIRTFTTRLKIITNIEDHNQLIESLNNNLPDADKNIGKKITPETEQDANPKQDTQTDASDSYLKTTSSSDAWNEPLSKKTSFSLFENMDKRFLKLSQSAYILEQIVQDQYELLADQRSFLAALPTRQPSIGYFTSGFGIRRSPYGQGIKMHEGLDIANRPKTPIWAPASGVVSFSAVKPGYGQVVVVEHGYGMQTWYAHLRLRLVKKGDHVRRGQKIAQMGSSGRVTGPHLHYEVRVNGTPVDPLSYILEF